jgi:hypothetical protein
MEVIKILGSASQLTGTGTTVPGSDNVGAQYVLVSNTGTTQTVTQKTGAGVTVGTIVTPPSSLLIIKKERTDTLESASGTSVHVTSVVYQG